MRTGAVISPDGRYRYRLWRIWDDWAATMTFIMLNPSTADATVDDPTIRRCVGFAKREGCGGIAVVNLFAYRATKPAELLTVDDPHGPENRKHIIRAMETTGPVVAAWGAWWHTHQAKRNGTNLHRIAPESFAVQAGRTLHCLGTTKAGAPRHPLYVPADQPLEVFR